MMMMPGATLERARTPSVRLQRANAAVAGSAKWQRRKANAIAIAELTLRCVALRRTTRRDASARISRG